MSAGLHGLGPEVSYFETGRYVPPPDAPRQWSVPAGAYDPETDEAFRGMVERARFVEELGFDWVSVSEHHYSPRILTPSPAVAPLGERRASLRGARELAASL